MRLDQQGSFSMDNLTATSPKSAPPRRARSSTVIALSIFSGILGLWWWLDDSSTGRVAVTGTVRFRGEPLARGIIRFLPQERGLQPGGSIISCGRYLITSGNGLMPGLYSIAITAPKPVAPVNEVTLQPRKLIELIPSDYNRRTTLFRSLQRGPRNVLDFDLSPSSPAH